MNGISALLEEPLASSLSSLPSCQDVVRKHSFMTQEEIPSLPSSLQNWEQQISVAHKPPSTLVLTLWVVTPRECV